MYYGDALNLALGFLNTFALLAIVWVVLEVVAGWRIFQKAGQPGWVSIVPFYNSYIEYKIYWGNGWLFLVPLVLTFLGAVPVIGGVLVLAAAIIGIITKYRQAVAFGQGIGFTIGLVLLNPIFCMILGFGNYEYFGIPMDGYSYDELRGKFNAYKAGHSQQTTYQQPDAPQGPRVRYQQPGEPPQQQYSRGHGPVYAQQQPPVTHAPEQDSPDMDTTQNQQ